MSRGVKDLRDLICVSRLTVRESDDDYSGSDEDFRPDTALSFRGPLASRLSSASSTTASDSGVGTNGVSPDAPLNLATEDAASVGAVPAKRKKRKKKRKPKELPPVECPVKLPVLPPVTSSVPPAAQTESVNFDVLMKHINAAVVADMLERSNSAVHRLSSWCRTPHNWIEFAHFWLNSFPEQQRTDIFQLEYSCLVDELCLAFSAGLNSGSVTLAELNALVGAVLREYPDRLSGERGSYLFLDYLDILSSDRSSEYRRLLTDVKLSTRNREYAQWYLAIRSFGLVSIWSAVISFFKELCRTETLEEVSLVDPQPSSVLPPEIPLEQRIFHIIKCGFTEVLHYFVKTKKIDPVKYLDKQNRSLIFLAVTCNQHRMMRYLLKMKPAVPVDSVSETGNTPLHAAVSSGDLDLVAMLVEVGHADVNCVNIDCDNSTPLHLAVIYGNAPIVSYLLEHGAESQSLVGDQSSTDLAKELGHTYIHELLVRHENDELTPRAETSDHISSSN